jgi:dTDP-4-dehydrorhamnose 3,5-epimerase
MDIVPLDLPGMLLITTPVYPDFRGSFMEAWNERKLATAGVDAHFVQDNLSSSRRYTLRGLHYQLPSAQQKLIRVLRGEIFDVVVDVRRSSGTFGRWASVTLAGGDGRALWVPQGFAHGFLALADDTLVHYKVTDYWAPQHEQTLLWNDPALGIPWPVPAGAIPILSDKDAAGLPLASAKAYP